MHAREDPLRISSFDERQALRLASSREREEKERKTTRGKKGERAKERNEFSPVSQGLESRCESQENVRNGYWSQDERRDTEWQYRAFPSLLSKRSLYRGEGERGGVRPPKSQLAVYRELIFSLFSSFFSNTIQNMVPSRTLNPDRKFERITASLETPEIFIRLRVTKVSAASRVLASEISSSVYAHRVYYARLFA